MKLQSSVVQEKKASVIMIEGTSSKVDKEYDWTDRLKQWKKVQLAEGAIVDLSAKGQLNSQSASLAILGLLQSEFTVDQINKTIEDSLVNGLRRSAGLNLLNYAMGLSGNSQIFFDMIQWFSASLRQRKNTSVHFLDGLMSCGNSCEGGIRVQFFKILKKVDLKLRTCNEIDELKLLLNVLCWNFKAADHEQLSKLNVFETLHKGDGSDLSWVKYNLGTYLNHSWNS
jgi:predicted DNA-binding antitoxin AbrB/MazE fold protein